MKKTSTVLTPVPGQIIEEKINENENFYHYVPVGSKKLICISPNRLLSEFLMTGKTWFERSFKTNLILPPRKKFIPRNK